MIRIMFESNGKNQINEGDVFRYIADAYIGNFEFGMFFSYSGFISVASRYLREDKFEPCWQYIMHPKDNMDKDVLQSIPGLLAHHAKFVPCPGYHIKVSDSQPNEEEKYLYY